MGIYFMALFYIAKMLYEGIDEIERFYVKLDNDKLKLKT